LAAQASALSQQPPPPQSEAPKTTEVDRTAATPQTPTASSDPRDPVFYPGDTERFKPLIHKLVANLWLDQKEIWTSPFHMHSKDAKWWLGFGAVTAALVATDHRTSNALENSRLQVRWGNRVSNLGASYTLIPVVAGFYGFGVLRDDAKPREVGVLGAEALLDSLIVVEILKTVASRNRPDSTISPGKFFAGGTGFPSGHAMESWALASVIAHEYKHQKLVPFLAYGLAGVVSAARFTAQKHYAGDIVAGGAMGWFIGRYVYQTHMDHAIHHRAWLKPRIAPEVLPGSGTYMVSLTFGN
jgi:membrane-associated phospholipid phosphatase